MVNGTLLNFGKRYEDDLRVIFDQRPKLHLGFEALSNQKILNGIQYTLVKGMVKQKKAKYFGILKYELHSHLKKIG